MGIFTVGANGQGPGIVTYADYSLVSPAKAANCGGPNTTCGAANPGDTLILWATGLGPVSGSDASGAGLGQNMPAIPLTLWLGGVQAPVIYQGRSGCCIGEDQIVFTVPNNVPTGCAVPLLIQIGNQISNATVMPVASGSRSCTGTNPALASVGAAQRRAAGRRRTRYLRQYHAEQGSRPPKAPGVLLGQREIRVSQGSYATPRVPSLSSRPTSTTSRWAPAWFTTRSIRIRTTA